MSKSYMRLGLTVRRFLYAALASSLILWNGVMCDLDYPEYDPTDTILKAVPIEPDGSWHEDTINNMESLDSFSFEAEAGQAYKVETAGEANTYLSLYDSDGLSHLMWHDNYASDYNQHFWLATHDGLYYVRVTEPGIRTFADYSVSISTITDDHGNSAEHATSISTDAQKYDGKNDHPADVDYFRFTADANQRLTITASNPIDNIQVTLLDSDGSTLLFPDYVSTFLPQSTFIWVSEDAQDYYLRIKDRYLPMDGWEVVPYTIRVKSMPDDGNFDTTSAVVVTPDSDPVEYYLDAGEDVDYFAFSAEEGVTYVIQTLGETDTYIELLNPKGTAYILRDDDKGENDNGRIAWRCTESMTYYVAVWHYYGHMAYNILSYSDNIDYDYLVATGFYELSITTE